MAEPFIGEISMFGFSFAPQGWSFCNGVSMAIAQQQTLFSLLGVTFGGDGLTSFNLPDLQGRMPMGMGNGTPLTPRPIGQSFGAEIEHLQTSNLPAHNHTMAASNTPYTGLTQAPAAGWTLGAPSSTTGGKTPTVVPVNMYGPSAPPSPVQSAPSSSVGDGTAFSVMNPTLVLNFCIALTGYYPSRT